MKLSEYIRAEKIIRDSQTRKLIKILKEKIVRFIDVYVFKHIFRVVRNNINS